MTPDHWTTPPTPDKRELVPWADLTAEQRDWFAKGWEASGEGWNGEYPGVPAEQAYTHLTKEPY